MSNIDFPQTQSIVTSSSMPTLRDYYRDVWVPENKGLSHTTLGVYEKYMRKYVDPLLGGYPLDKIGHREVQTLINSCPTYKTARDAKATLSSILSHAVTVSEILWANSALGRFRYPLKTDGREKQGETLQSFDEIREYLRQMKALNFPMDVRKAATVGFLFGLRPGEGFGLDVPDVDLEVDVLRIHQSYSRGAHGCILNPKPKTDCGMRSLSIYPFAREALLELSSSPEGPWNRNRRDRRCDPQVTAAKFADWRARFKLQNVTFETMRHSFATSALRAGMSYADLAAWLGHSDPSITMQHYCRVDRKRIIEFGDLVNKAFTGGLEPPQQTEEAAAQLAALITRIAKAA